MTTLKDIFEGLKAPVGGGDLYAACPIPDTERCRIGKDHAGNPALLVSVTDNPQPPETTVQLSNLTFRPHCRCRLLSGQKESTETLAVLSSAPRDPALREYFLYALEGVMPAIAARPTSRELAELVEQLAELFRTLSLPSRSSLQGLWCELLLIRHSADVPEAASAWHLRPRDQYDFASARQRLEVKSTTNANRVHHFSLAQLMPPAGTSLVIASFVLDETGTGLSLSELWQEVRSQNGLSLELKSRLFRILAAALGADWQKASRIAYDQEAALSSLRLFDPRDIPTVDPALPPEVRDVHFCSELNCARCLPRSEVAERSGLFQAIFGQSGGIAAHFLGQADSGA